MKTIVSISPVRIEADTRTFKQAASISRFGYTSIVVEAEKSDLEKSMLPFELYSLSDAVLNGNQLSVAVESPTSRDSGVKQNVKAVLRRLGLTRLLSFAQNVRVFISGLARYLYRHGLMTFRSTPRASLYVLHSPLQFPAVYFLTKKYKAPFIYDAHDFYGRIEESDEGIPLNERWLKSVYRRVESLCVKRAAAVITVSQGIADLQRAKFGCKSIVIRNVQDARLGTATITNLRDVLQLPADRFLLVTVGQAKPGQALREMLDAMYTLPATIHLALVGRGYEQYLDEIRSKDLQERVHIVPPVKSYEVVPFIRTADAAIILYYARSPNYTNCLPNGFFQSVTAGLPLLYPELPEIQKIAEQYELGIAINPQSADSIRVGVLKLNDPATAMIY